MLAHDHTSWSAWVAATGAMPCVPTEWDGAPVLRLALVNPDTDADAVSATLGTLR